MGESETNSGGGGGMVLSLPMLFAGAYALVNHTSVHQAIHANIEPEAFAGMVAWAMFGLEFITAIVAAIGVLAMVLFVVLAFWKLAGYTS